MAAASNSPPEPDAPLVVIGGDSAPADVRALCSVLVGLDFGCGPIVCDVAVAPVDVGTVDALARLALAARRRGHPLLLRNASAELCELVALVGLTPVLPCPTASRVESGRQPEQREVPGGVEEEGDPADGAL